MFKFMHETWSCSARNSSKRNVSIAIHFEVSSIVKWGYPDNFKPVYFFYEKIPRAQKHSQAKINQQNKIKQTLNN